MAGYSFTFRAMLMVFCYYISTQRPPQLFSDCTKCHCVCCRTSARLLETKAANTSSQYNAAAGKNSTAAKNPAVVLALDRVNSDGAMYSTGQAPSAPNGAHYSMSSTVGGMPSLYGGTQGWETVRRIFNPHRGENRPVSKLSVLHKHWQNPWSVTPLLSP